MPAALLSSPTRFSPILDLELRARDLSAVLRCLVCQNQSIDDSNAPLARDLRLLVRERLKAGDTDAQVRDFVVARYGDFVLLKPPFSVTTLLLWIAPFWPCSARSHWLGAHSAMPAKRSPLARRAVP